MTIASGSQRLIDVANAFRTSRVALSACELGLFQTLARGVLDAPSLARELGIAERGARDFFDALVAMGLLARDRSGAYVNTADTAKYLLPDSPDSIVGAFTHIAGRSYPLWSRLTEALRNGRLDHTPPDGNFYEHIHGDPIARAQFAAGMTGTGRVAFRALAEALPWHEYTSVLDVGCAEGGFLVDLLQFHPHLTAIGLDVPAMREAFEAYVSRRRLSDSIRFHGSDFFAEPLPVADVVVLGRVLHNWDMRRKCALLAKILAHSIRRSLGRVVIGGDEAVGFA